MLMVDRWLKSSSAEASPDGCACTDSPGLLSSPCTAEKLGASRMAIGNAIRLMCRAKKSREGDHFGAAIGLRAQLEGFAPEIPDWANDRHTIAGKKLGRGLDHFRKEGATKLIPPPRTDDPYEDEAYRLWTIKQQSKGRRGPVTT